MVAARFNDLPAEEWQEVRSEIAEGGRVDARIEGVDPSTPESIRIGLPMKAAFIRRKDVGVPETYLSFEPA